MKHVKLLLAVALLGGCYEVQMSPEKRELGRVEQLTFIPATHSSGTGFTSGGHVAFVQTNTPEQYVIVFSCPHGKFAVNPTRDVAKRLYGKLAVGDSVTITYAEEWHIDKDGGRVLADLHFVDAGKR